MGDVLMDHTHKAMHIILSGVLLQASQLSSEQVAGKSYITKFGYTSRLSAHHDRLLYVSHAWAHITIGCYTSVTPERTSQCLGMLLVICPNLELCYMIISYVYDVIAHLIHAAVILYTHLSSCTQITARRLTCLTLTMTTASRHKSCGEWWRRWGRRPQTRSSSRSCGPPTSTVSTHLYSTHAHSTHVDSTQEHSTHVDSTQEHSTHLYSTHAQSTHVDSTHGHSTHADSTHVDNTRVCCTHAYSTHVDSTQEHSTHVYSTLTHSTHVYSTLTHSTHGHSTQTTATR